MLLRSVVGISDSESGKVLFIDADAMRESGGLTRDELEDGDVGDIDRGDMAISLVGKPLSIFQNRTVPSAEWVANVKGGKLASPNEWRPASYFAVGLLLLFNCCG